MIELFQMLWELFSLQKHTVKVPVATMLKEVYNSLYNNNILEFN